MADKEKKYPFDLTQKAVRKAIMTLDDGKKNLGITFFDTSIKAPLT